MKITTILFDLDGTLLPMDQDIFVKDYFGRLAKKMAPHGYEPKAFVDAIWKGIKAMVGNDGTRSNEDRFWEAFCRVFGDGALGDRPVLEDFYANDFPKVQASCGFQPEAVKTVRYLQDRDLRLVLATNPIFPDAATRHRIRWAGLEPEDFELYTTYENSGYCKPNPQYYRQILDKLGLVPQECLMVGNDVTEDMVAGELGMQVFLLTDCLINSHGADISRYPSGGFPELMEYLGRLIP